MSTDRIATKITPLDIEAYFDLEDFMNFSKESRLDADTLKLLNELWEQWGAQARIMKLERGKQTWLAVWLPQEVEDAIDEAWARSPGEGYLLNSLAQYICMVAVQALVPQAADGGCAPSPKPGLEFRQAMLDCGLAQEQSGALLRRYAVVTYFPFKGGCEICGMQENCPKGSGREEFASVVLPGYERE